MRRRKAPSGRSWGHCPKGAARIWNTCRTSGVCGDGAGRWRKTSPGRVAQTAHSGYGVSADKTTPFQDRGTAVRAASTSASAWLGRSCVTAATPRMALRRSPSTDTPRLVRARHRGPCRGWPLVPRTAELPNRGSSRMADGDRGLSGRCGQSDRKAVIASLTRRGTCCAGSRRVVNKNRGPSTWPPCPCPNQCAKKFFQA